MTALLAPLLYPAALLAYARLCRWVYRHRARLPRLERVRRALAYEGEPLDRD